MNLYKALISIATLLAVAIGYAYFSPFPSPNCQQYSGELRMGEEVTTFNFTLGRKTVDLATHFNLPLQQLGMPSALHYQFQILAVTQQSSLWRYRLKESNSGQLQELEIEPNGDAFSIRWVNDRANNIVYKCTELDDAKL